MNPITQNILIVLVSTACGFVSKIIWDWTKNRTEPYDPTRRCGAHDTMNDKLTKILAQTESSHAMLVELKGNVEELFNRMREVEKDIAVIQDRM